MVLLMPDPCDSQAISTYTPAQGATDVPSSDDIVLSFDQAVSAGTGDVVLTPAARPHTSQATGESSSWPDSGTHS